MGKSLERQIIRFYLGSESKTLGVGPAICVLTSPPGDSDACHSVRTSAQEFLSLQASAGSPAAVVVPGAGIHTSALRRSPCLSARTTGRGYGGTLNCSS